MPCGLPVQEHHTAAGDHQFGQHIIVDRCHQRQVHGQERSKGGRAEGDKARCGHNDARTGENQQDDTSTQGNIEQPQGQQIAAAQPIDRRGQQIVEGWLMKFIAYPCNRQARPKPLVFQPL